MTDAEFRRAGWGLLVTMIGASVLFRQIPQIDLWVAALFYDGAGGFLGAGAGWQFARHAIWDFALVVFALSGLATLVAWRRQRPVWAVPARIWGYIFALFLLAPGLLVNGFLKANSGRARPAHLAEFGGDKIFTPAWTFTDQCSSNCSFVSGEVSGVVALAVALMILGALWRRILPVWAVLSLHAASGAMVAFVILQRIAQGRHFLSDVTFAALLTLVVAWGLWGLFGRGWFAALRKPPGKS